MKQEVITERLFQGRGWAFPSRVSGGDIASAAGEEDIEQAIRIILETAPGERVMRPEFGVGLRRMVFTPVTRSSLSVAQAHIEEALTLWEPRIDVQSVEVRVDQARSGVLEIEIRYRIRESNSFANFVYPFYLTEGQ